MSIEMIIIDEEGNYEMTKMTYWGTPGGKVKVLEVAP